MAQEAGIGSLYMAPAPGSRDPRPASEADATKAHPWQSNPAIWATAPKVLQPLRTALPAQGQVFTPYAPAEGSSDLRTLPLGLYRVSSDETGCQGPLSEK